MRNLFFLLFFWGSVACRAQIDSVRHYELRKVFISEARYVRDLVADLDQRAVPVTLAMATRQKGREIRVESPGSQLSDQVRMVLVGAQTGSRVFFDLKYRLAGDSTLRMRSQPFVIKVLP